MDLKADLRSLQSNWNAVYRYNGGLRSLARCSYGSLKLRTGVLSSIGMSSAGVDCLSFSVVPNLTVLWHAFVERAVDIQPRRIIVGDCAGNFHLRFSNYPADVEVFPIFNHVHGVKLDWFIANICQAEYVFISDDDVFLLNPEPLRWALRQMRDDPNIAVVSLMPRGSVPSYLQGQVAEPMGSYCLVIRRNIWLKEKLSFRVVRSPGKGRIYDTADLANVLLIQRGFDVRVAPNQIRNQMISYEGISQWTLKIHKYRGNIGHLVEDIPIRQEKALLTSYFAEQFPGVARQILNFRVDLEIIPKQYLEIAKNVLEPLLGDRKYVIESKVRTNVNRLLEASAKSSYG